MLFEGLGSNSPLSVALLSVCFSNVLATEKAYCTIFSAGGGGNHIHTEIQYSVTNIPFVTVADPLLCSVDEFNFIIGMHVGD